jgi:RHS repeat-associated protein
MKTMTTWTNFATGAGAATTTWNYDPYRGFLTNKAYADGKGPTYAYTPAGRLRSRTWARGILTLYAYNNAGELSGVSYSDHTAAVTYGCDRLGRQTTVSQGQAVTVRAYNIAGQLLSESYTGGPLDGLSVTNGYDSLLRRTALTLNSQLSTLNSVAYGYDPASRLQTVADANNNSATYTYLANSALLDSIVFQQAGTTRMTTTKQHDYLNRLQSVSSSSSLGFSYSYNSANQRTAMTNADGSYWVYEFDGLGQVTSGKNHWADGTPVAGQQFEYGFDDIGNRQTTGAGADALGGNLRHASYAANALNQYTSRTVPGALDVIGAASSNATVTVNKEATYRKGEYFRAELPVNNATGAVWQALETVGAVRGTSTNNPDVVSTLGGGNFLPQTPEAFVFDLDGTLTSDGRWTYGWDAENRLVRLVTRTNAGPQILIRFEYDWQGRRTHKQAWPNRNGSGNPTNDVTFVYDGWNLVAELNATNNAVIRSYLWGNDLSGTMQGAGGVGGLLFIGDVASTNGYYAPAYDGNGNVSALVNAADGTVAAQYEYGPFGEVLRATGLMAKANPFRFSTKYQDDETDLLYYGYRYYNASTGRWLSRDPAQEGGGANLYGFCGNNPSDCFDVLGLEWKVKRNSNNARGIAWATSDSDTFDALATKIHLDTKDYKTWAQTTDPKPSACKIYGIPNTVFIDIGPRYRNDQPWYVRWSFKISLTQTFLRQLAERSGDLYEQNGFKVVRTESASGTDIRNHLGSPDIYAYFFAGHGGDGAINSTEDDAVFPGRYTRYGIQFMGLLACGSALDNTGTTMNIYPSNVARRGVFYGSIDNYTAILAIIIGAGDFIWISTPGTNE